MRSWVTRIGTKSVTDAAGAARRTARSAIRADGVMRACSTIATDASRPLTDDERAYWGRSSSGVTGQARISSVQHLTLPPALSSSPRSTPTGT